MPGVRACSPRQASPPKRPLPPTTISGARSLSLSNMAFHCRASSGAGACRRAGTAETVWVKVLPGSYCQ